MNTNTNRAATHDGTCQLCGRRQRLPKGRLSNHGYTVEWNFFHGVCHGAHALPFEQSKDLIEDAIVRAEQAAADLRAEAAAVVADPTTTIGWVHEFTGNYAKGTAVYAWRQVEVSEESGRGAGLDGVVREWSEIGYTDRNGRRVNAFHHGVTYDVEKTPAAVAASLNRSRARALVANAEKFDAYVRWQQERIANWKPADLLPLGGGR